MQELTAYIGLGSNLDDPVNQVQTALEELNAIHQTRLIRHSSLYRSDPVGPPGQPDYINAVAEIETCLEPLPLLRELQAIEQKHQRVRRIRWGPRTLDLDLLIYGNTQIEDPDLTVPHAMLTERSFVLYPLAEIAPDLQIPGHGCVAELLKNLSGQDLSKIGDS